MDFLKVKNFAKAKVSLPLPYLLSGQKDNWKLFWDRDLKELFQEVSPIRDYTGKELELWFLDYKLDEPKYKSDFEARLNNDSYEASLRVRTKLVNLKTKEIKEQEVFLTDFPLMTERGTFIVNGVERVTISQLIRSPGAFFTIQRSGRKNLFGAKIIPNRGAWLEVETEPSGSISVKIDRRRKVMATTLLRILGLIENMFFNFERYDLSKVGRWRMWQRLPGLKPKSQRGKKEMEEEIKLADRTLKLEDAVAVIKEIIRLNNTPGSKPDQIDHLGNRRVRTQNELMQNRLRVGLMRMERIIKDRMSTLDVYTLTPSQLINPRPF